LDRSQTLAGGGGEQLVLFGIALQLEHRGQLFVDDVEEAFGWIDRRAAPIGATVIAGHLHGVALAGRRVHAFVAGAENLVTELGALFGAEKGAEIIGGEALTGKGWRLGGEGLRGPGFLAGHVGLGDLALLHGPDGLAGVTLELPVSRSKTQTKPCLLTMATMSRDLPAWLTVRSFGAVAPS